MPAKRSRGEQQPPAPDAAAAPAPPPHEQRRYPLPFVGAKVRRFIGGFMPLLQRLLCQLLLGAGGFDLGTVQALREDHPTDPDARALRILQGKAEPLPWWFRVLAGRETWMVQAARDGVLELVKGLRAEGCPWDEWTCSAAAGGGHLEVLQWARAEGCPWNAETCRMAARGGHLEVLQWARAEGCP